MPFDIYHLESFEGFDGEGGALSIFEEGGPGKKSVPRAKHLRKIAKASRKKNRRRK
jgi:hypothetical protein